MALQNTQKLAKFLSYILGRRPDEFGLVLDKHGFVSIKELLKALNEEEGWRHIRMSHLREVAITIAPSPIEFIDNRIRARERTQVPMITPVTQMPKLLYIAVRNRAYPNIAQKGLHANLPSPLVLASEITMARRIGQRRDHAPVILTVQVNQSMKKGTRYDKYGENLYLTDTILPGTFTGPPLPKEKPSIGKPKRPHAQPVEKTPGSYFPDLSPPSEPKRSRRKEVEWKKDRRRARKYKQRQNHYKTN